MRRLSFNFFAIFGSWLLLVPATYAITLPEVLARVETENTAVQQAKARLEATDALEDRAFGAFVPDLSADATWAHTDASPENSTTRNAGLVLEQTLFAGGKLWAGYDAATAQRQNARAAYEDTLHNQQFAVAQTFVDLITAQAVLRQQQNLVDVLTRQQEAVNVRFKLQDATRTDVAQADARLASARAEVMQAQRDLVNLRTQLEEQVGALPAPPVSFTGSLEAPARSEVFSSLVNHPARRAAEAQLAAAEHEVRIQQGDLWPALSAQADYDYNSGFRLNNEGSTRVQVQVSVPLFTGGEIRGRIKEQRAAAAEARSALLAVQRGLEADARVAWQNYETARTSAQAFEAAVKAAQLAAEGIRKEAKFGNRSTLDVLNTEQDLLETQVNRTRAAANVLVRKLELYSLMGQDLSTLLDVPDENG